MVRVEDLQRDPEMVMQFHKSREDKQNLIEQKLQSKSISPAFGKLLENIHTSTFAGDSGFDKVKMILHIRDDLRPEIKGKIAYLGSGSDWQFPVALGARRIDMIDSGFKNEGNFAASLVENILKFDPHPNVTPHNNPDIFFSIDVGNGPERVHLHLVEQDAQDYVPQTELSGMINYLGPHLSDIPKKIKERLKDGAFIINNRIDPAAFDHDKSLVQMKNSDFMYYKKNMTPLEKIFHKR